MRVKYAALVAGLALGLMSGTAKAAVIVNINENGSNVVINGSGILNLTGLVSDYSGGTVVSAITPSYAAITAAPNGTFVSNYYLVSAPSSFGSKGTIYPDSFSGTEFGIGRNFISLPDNVFSLSFYAVSFTMTFNNSSLESLGIIPLRAYNYVLPNDSISLVVGAGPFTPPSTVSLPASAPMFGAALLALGAIGYGVKRKKGAAAA